MRPRRASLIVGIEFTIKSCVRGHHFSKEFIVHQRWEKSWLDLYFKLHTYIVCMILYMAWPAAAAADVTPTIVLVQMPR